VDEARLAGLMDEMVDLLKAHGEEHWAEWVEYDARLIRERDGHGVEHFLAAFGSMGSLYDLVFHPVNGNATSEAEGRTATERLHELIAEAYPIAQDIEHELDTTEYVVAGEEPQATGGYAGYESADEREEPRDFGY
jgi:hypothetical protein